MVATFRYLRGYFDAISKEQTNEDFLNELVNRVGSFVMFCYFKTWDLASPKNTRNENNELRMNWIASAASIKGGIRSFDGFMGRSYYLNNKKEIDMMSKETSNEFFSEFNQKRGKELEKLLLQKNPELEQVDDVWKTLKSNDWTAINFDIEKSTAVFENESITARK